MQGRVTQWFRFIATGGFLLSKVVMLFEERENIFLIDVSDVISAQY